MEFFVYFIEEKWLKIILITTRKLMDIPSQWDGCWNRCERMTKLTKNSMVIDVSKR